MPRFAAQQAPAAEPDAGLCSAPAGEQQSPRRRQSVLLLRTERSDPAERDACFHENSARSPRPSTTPEPTASSRIRPQARTRRAGRSRYGARLAGPLGSSQSGFRCATVRDSRRTPRSRAQECSPRNPGSRTGAARAGLDRRQLAKSSSCSSGKAICTGGIGDRILKEPCAVRDEGLASSTAETPAVGVVGLFVVRVRQPCSQVALRTAGTFALLVNTGAMTLPGVEAVRVAEEMAGFVDDGEAEHSPVALHLGP